MNDSIIAQWIIGSYRDNEGLPEKLYNGFEVDWDWLNNFHPDSVSRFLDDELERFIAFNPSEKEHRQLFCNYLKVRMRGLERWRNIGRRLNAKYGDFLINDTEVWDKLGQSIVNYCEQATEPQQSEPEVEPTSKQIEKLRYLHLSGLLPHLIEQHKRISGQTSANWDSIAHVVSKMIGEPVSSIRKPIREHYTSLNNRLEDFKSKEEVLGFLKSKKVRE